MTVLLLLDFHTFTFVNMNTYSMLPVTLISRYHGVVCVCDKPVVVLDWKQLHVCRLREKTSTPDAAGELREQGAACHQPTWAKVSGTETTGAVFPFMINQKKYQHIPVRVWLLSFLWILQVYRNAFGCFIGAFRTYRPLLSAIKTEYENTLGQYGYNYYHKSLKVF